MDDELNHIENHQVWFDQCEKPKQNLNSTWVFKTKSATASFSKKPKAGLCIQGFLQTHGEDFFQNLCPHWQISSLLVLLVLAIDLKLPICQFDFESAFIFSPLKEGIFIKMPEGSKRIAPYPKLVKSLYGLKQAPKYWFKTLTLWFEDINYCPSGSDMCLFIHKVCLNPDLSRRALKCLGYRNIGMLNYLAFGTRPDLASAVSIISKFNQQPGISHWKELLHCQKYLKGTEDMGLLLKPKPNKLLNQIMWFTDATWGEDQELRISRSRSLAFWKSCPILWNSKKQRNITMSSTESEMNALSDGEQESQWLSFLLKELWRIKLAPTLFHLDNKGLLEKSKNFGSNS
ncbi:hypothetical protein VP01_666g7 [Puccinia sorghi]|uniref:Reverse transcriptase Ty1/copia-type domain-containing protein n=1 Tax=Puccinia sorghi TaxID=27349 RepID=A0A0L6UFQ9_9BASI|nr:hypothetical protein VP01_666g7 [Puccinia sorghi]